MTYLEIFHIGDPKERRHPSMTKVLVVGVLALQGAFIEHLTLLREAAAGVKLRGGTAWQFSEIRTPLELTACHALVIPGGESTTVSLVAARCGLLEPLRDFVKYDYSKDAGLIYVPLLIVIWTEPNGSRHGVPALA